MMCRNRVVKRPKIMLLIVIVMTLGIQTFAYGFSGGTGEPNDPYQIATTEDLISIGSDPNLLDKHYILIADVNLTGQVFSTAVIAPDTEYQEGFDGTAFTGWFDGWGHKIMKLRIDTNKDGSEFLGLFGRVGEDGQVKNLGVTTVNVSGTGRYANFLGALAGENNGLIHQCYATGEISAGDWSENVAGLVGSNNGMIYQCYTTANISGGQFSNLAGLTVSNTGFINQCYTTASISAATFSNRAGLLGSDTGLVTNCYFLDPTDGGGPDNGLGVALTAEQLKQAEFLAGWVFFGTDTDGRFDAWFMPEQSYPVLTWQTHVTGLVWLPQVKRTTLEETQGMIETAGLKLGEISYDFNNKVPPDRVVSLIPRGPVATGTVVNVLISLGITDWEQNAGDGTQSNPYQIISVGQLECMGENSSLWTKHFVIANSIDMSDRLYHDAVIASFPDENNCYFRGGLDGGGYEILGLSIVSAGNYVGLFGRIDSGATLRNIILKDTNIIAQSSSDSGGAGLLAGLCSGGSLIDCSTSGSAVGINRVGGLVGASDHNATLNRCSCNVTISGDGRLGGLLGYSHATIIQCSVEGTVSGNYSVGGLVGYSPWSTGNLQVRESYTSTTVLGGTHIGGLVGYGMNPVINECYATGIISGNENVGGLAGRMGRQSTISQCFATGDVSGDNYLGGLVGWNNQGSIYQCFAIGTVSGSHQLGGLVGYASFSSIQQSFATGKVSGEGNRYGGLVGNCDNTDIIQCYANGNVAGNEYIGGLAGSAYYDSIRECYATGAVTGNDTIGGFVGYRELGKTTEGFWDIETSVLNESPYGGIGLSTAEMQTASTFIDAGWDFAETWIINEGVDYPRFQWEAVAY